MYVNHLNNAILGRSNFAGEIGELRLWDRVLSQSEIQAKLSQILNPTNELGLVGYWRFSEGAGNTTYDLAGHNNGFIYGATWSSDFPNTTFEPPSIIQQPINQVVSLHGTNAVFNVTAIGSNPLNYQWLFNGTNIQGATSSSLEFTNARTQDLGTYAVVVSNILGSVTSSNAALFMKPFLLSPFPGATILWGQNTTLSVTPAGTGPFFFQWFKDGLAIGDATNQTYAISSTQFTNAGFYSVVVTSLFGTVTNTAAQLVVNPAGVTIGMYPGLSITGTVGYSYIIQATPNLLNTNGWLTLTNLILQQTQQFWFDSTINVYNPANPQRYYRVLPEQ